MRQGVEGGEAGDASLGRLLRLAGARREQKVCVAGPGALERLLALHRLGFDEACCMGGSACGCAGEPCDVLLLTGPVSPERLGAMLARLRVGGVLAAEEADLQDDARIEAALLARGREPGWRVHDMAEGGCRVAMQVLPRTVVAPAAAMRAA